jgi:hypothetical protein
MIILYSTNELNINWNDSVKMEAHRLDDADFGGVQSLSQQFKARLTMISKSFIVLS